MQELGHSLIVQLIGMTHFIDLRFTDVRAATCHVVQLIVLRVEILCYFRYGAISPLQADSALS